MEFQTGVGSCQLLVAVRVPGETGDSSFHVVRISEDTSESGQDESRKHSEVTAVTPSYRNTLMVLADGVSWIPSTSSSSSK